MHTEMPVSDSIDGAREICWFEDGFPAHFCAGRRTWQGTDVKASIRMKHDDLLKMAQAQGF